MLAEDGHVAAVKDGREYRFAPIFARTAAIGSPTDIVDTLVALYEGPHRWQLVAARVVLHAYCDDDPSALCGHGLESGAMPDKELLLIARHLLQHALIGTEDVRHSESTPTTRGFDVAEYVAAAQVHLGLSATDAMQLTMTQFRRMMRLKYPEPERPDMDAYRAWKATL